MVSLLSGLTDTESLTLCHRVVDGLCGREPPHKGDYSASWSSEEWLELLDSLVALFRRAVGTNSSDEEVLVGLLDAGRSHAQSVLTVLTARRQEIRDALLDRSNSISSAALQDFDWQLKDKLSQLHVPDSTWKWITDFPSDRKQHEKPGKHVSAPRTISTISGGMLSHLPPSPCVTPPSPLWPPSVSWAALSPRTWELNISSITNKAQQRMFFLRQLKKLNLPNDGSLLHGHHGVHPLLLHHCLVRCSHSQGQGQPAACHPLCRETDRLQSAVSPELVRFQDSEAR
ncbi:COMM domain-containing protein 8 isoform 2-T2 [Spinachia spinachia]